MAYAYQKERSEPVITFLVGNNSQQQHPKRVTKASSFVMRLKAMENSRLQKGTIGRHAEGRRNLPARFQSVRPNSRDSEQFYSSTDQHNLRRSLEKLSLASLLTQPQPRQPTSSNQQEKSSNKRTPVSSISRLQNRIAKQSPLYGMLVEELSRSFLKKQVQRPQRYRRVESRKQPMTSDAHVDRYIAVIEKEPEILALELQVAGHNPEHFPTEFVGKISSSAYYSTSANLQQNITEAIREKEEQNKSPKCKPSISSTRPNTVCQKYCTEQISPTRPIHDVVELYGRQELLQGEDLLQYKMMVYRDFLWKVAFSNQMILQPFERPKYYIGRGNNSKLLRLLMGRRWWWIRQYKQESANLSWTQLKVFEVYQRQLSSPKLPFQQEESPYELKEKDRKDPSSRILNEHQLRKWRSYLSRNHLREKKATQTLDCRKQLIQNCRKQDQQDCLLITNHLQFSRFIGNKKALLFTMRQYYELSGEDHSQYLPKTFHITGGIEDDEYLNFLSIYHQRKKTSQPNIWIIKPGELSNRGNGINVCDSLDSVKLILKNKQRHENGKFKTYILQQYLDSPFLYRGRKFDIRHYILVTRVNGVLKGYWYEQGYIRTTSYEYNLAQMNSQIHLTNDAVQKHCRDYGRFEKGNKLSYRQFQQYLDQKHGPNTYDFYSLVQVKIGKIATDIIRAASQTIDPKRRLNNFEVFGMDFMIDSAFKPWLIEVNTNPCLELASPLLAKLIPAMVDNALRIAVDPLYPPPWGSNRKVYPQTNRFTLVYDELVHGPQLQKIYGKEKMIWEVLDNVGEDDEAYQDRDSDDDE